MQGKSLPATTIAEFGGGIEALSGSITLRSDRTYSLEILFRVTQGTAVTTDTYDEPGTYVQNGNVVTFTESGTSSGVTGLISGNVLTVDNGGLVLGFRK